MYPKDEMRACMLGSASMGTTETSIPTVGVKVSPKRRIRASRDKASPVVNTSKYVRRISSSIFCKKLTSTQRRTLRLFDEVTTDVFSAKCSIVVATSS